MTPYHRTVATDGVLYQAPVLRRLPLQLGVSVVIGIMVGGLIAILEGPPYTLGIAIGIAVFVVVVSLTQALMPIRIEFRPGEVTLVSPRTSSKYRAETVSVRRDPNGAFRFGRRGNPKSHIASFWDRDPEAVRQACETAGVGIDP
jgi:hypothetical protein